MVYKNTNKVNDYPPHPLRGDFSLDSPSSLDLGLNLVLHVVYHLQPPCSEVTSPISDGMEGFAVWTLPAEILDKSSSGKCQSPGSSWVAEKRELFCIPLSPWIVT